MFPLLETLVAVYEVGQFTLAADELKVSQSTVSSRIAQLEQMVGAPLFVRNAKSDVTPTQAGRMLYQTAIGIDGLWRDTREQIARVQEAREPLAVSFSHTTAAILLPKALPVMARNMDGFDFAVHVMNSDAILEQAKTQGMEAVIPPKKNRKIQRPYRADLYRLRHRVENAFVHLKRWRGIATRYAKKSASFLAAVHIAALVAYWIN